MRAPCRDFSACQSAGPGDVMALAASPWLQRGRALPPDPLLGSPRARCRLVERGRRAARTSFV